MPFDTFFQSGTTRPPETEEVMSELRRLESLPYLEKKKLYQELWDKKRSSAEKLPRAQFLFWHNWRRRLNIRQSGQLTHDARAKIYLGGNVLSGYNGMDNQSHKPQRRPGKLYK